MGVASRMRQVGAVLGALVCLSAPALAQPPAQEPGLPMWVVRDADSTIYITGTVHLLRDGQQWRNAKLDAAFAEAKELWLEVAAIGDPEILNTELEPLIEKYAAYDGPPLSTLLSADEYAKLKDTLAARGADAEDFARLDRLQPWMAINALGRDVYTGGAYKAENGIDYALAAMAKSRGIPIRGMESLEVQVALSAGGTVEEQVAHLRMMIASPPQLQERGQRVADLAFGGWIRGEVHMAEALITLQHLSAGLRGASYDDLFRNRNENWSAVIETMLKDAGVSFIAVGAGHLVGKDSLQERLKLRGITAERY